MDYTRLLAEMKLRSDEEIYKLSREYGFSFSIDEIQKLKPLLDEISMYWILTGVPDSFVSKVAQVIGDQRTNQLMEDYLNMKK